jgi:hypothetical protein
MIKGFSKTPILVERIIAHVRQHSDLMWDFFNKKRKHTSCRVPCKVYPDYSDLASRQDTNGGTFGKHKACFSKAKVVESFIKGNLGNIASFSFAYSSIRLHFPTRICSYTCENHNSAMRLYHFTTQIE